MLLSQLHRQFPQRSFLVNSLWMTNFYIKYIDVGNNNKPKIYKYTHSINFYLNLFLKYNFILFYFIFFLCWVFVSMRELSLVVASRGHSSSRCIGLSLSWPLLLRGTGSRRAGSAVVAHGPCCSMACEIFPDQGSNPCPLHLQADSQPLHHQGSPILKYSQRNGKHNALSKTH